MAEVTIRAATAADHAAAEDVYRRASLVWDDDRPHLLANPGLLRIDVAHVVAGTIRVAVAGGRVLGFSRLVVEGVHAELAALFVDPDCFRQGLGRRLVADAVEQARQAGCSVLHVVANRNAEAFYRAVGFTGDEVVATRFAPALHLHQVVG